MVYWPILVSVILGILRGIGEGMVMIQPNDPMFSTNVFGEGVRGHAWFNVYHGITCMRDIGFVVLGAFLYAGLLSMGRKSVNADSARTKWKRRGMARFAAALLLCAVTINLFNELAYSYARWESLVNTYPEHVSFLGMMSLHVPAWTMHLIRVALIIGLTAAARWLRTQFGPP